MIKGRKSYIMATMMMTNHYHDIILMVTVNVMMKTKVTSIFLKGYKAEIIYSANDYEKYNILKRKE